MHFGCCYGMINKEEWQRRYGMKLLVIGGVAAGTKAAAKFKRVNPEAEVTIVTKGKDISYAGCGLPYYVGGAIPEKEQLIVNTPEKYSSLTGAMVYPQREVVALDPVGKKAVAKNIRTGAEEVYAYDACIVAVGASPVVPPLPGLNLPGVFVMRTPDDAIETRDYIARDNVKRAVVVGGGFIGLEVAENLLEKGLSVTVMDMAPQIMPGFDAEMADYAVRHLAKKGIKVLTATKLEAVTGDERAQGVQTDKGLLPADVVVLSIGIRPNTGFLQDTGMEMFKGTILVDEKMATNLPDIYAAGDCAMVKNRITGERQWSPMGSSANLIKRHSHNLHGQTGRHNHIAVSEPLRRFRNLLVFRRGNLPVSGDHADIEIICSLIVQTAQRLYPGNLPRRNRHHTRLTLHLHHIEEGCTLQNLGVRIAIPFQSVLQQIGSLTLSAD